MYYKKSVRKNFTKSIGKVCVEVFLDKAAGWRTEFLSKKDSGMGVFWKFVEISKNSLYKTILGNCFNFPKSDAESFA